ncbi:unnamed protein product [Rhizophagus irregularis]|nr:unnamed protein product [Rhizophagus irregularis]
MLWSADRSEIVNEINLQRDVDFHNNIIRFYGITKHASENIFNPTKDYLLVMEYADSGTLRDYLKNNFHRLTWNDKYNLASQLARSILCLHEEGIIHRDLHSCRREEIISGTPDDYSNLYTECWNEDMNI